MGASPAGAFFMPMGGEADAEETETAVPLPRMPEAGRRGLLWGTHKADEQALQPFRQGL